MALVPYQKRVLRLKLLNGIELELFGQFGALRVAFAGDSLSLYEGHYVQATSPPYYVDDGAAAGCGFTNGAPTR